MKPSDYLKSIDENQKAMRKEMQDFLILLTQTNSQVEIHNEVLFNEEVGVQVEIGRLKDWRSKLKGIWIAVGIIAVSLSTVAGLVIAYFKS